MFPNGYYAYLPYDALSRTRQDRNRTRIAAIAMKILITTTHRMMRVQMQIMSTKVATQAMDNMKTKTNMLTITMMLKMAPRMSPRESLHRLCQAETAT